MRYYLKYTILTWALLLSAATATTINVPADSTTIQAALNAAQTGDTVLVQPGTYYENIFWPDVNGIKLLSAGDTSNTVIDGGGNGSVIYLNPSTATIDSTTEIRGFRITNGGNIGSGGGMLIDSASPTLSRLWVTGNTAPYFGGGLYITNSSPTLTNVTVTGNTAGSSGGGINIYGGSPTLADVTVTGNTATNDGGGLYLQGSSPTLTDVTVTGNTARNGGGLCIDSGSPMLTDVTVTGNTAGSSGGGLYLYWSSPALTDVTVSGNTARNGGGLYLLWSSSMLTDVIVTGNTADSGGGIYETLHSSTNLVNVTISGNTAAYGGGIYISDSNPIIVNTILWNNFPQEIYFHSYGETPADTIIISYSDVMGGESGIETNDRGIVYWMDGNKDENPIFFNAIAGDYHLSSFSPAIGAGIESIQIDGTWYDAPSADFEGNLRPNPPGSNPDLGAYENSLSEPFPPPAIHAVADVTILEDSTVSFILSADDQPEAVLRYQVFGHDNIAVIINDSLITLQPAANFFTSSPIPLHAQACNQYVCGPVDTFNITVISVNDPPTATLETATVADTEPTGIILTGNPGPANEADQTLTYVLISLPEIGTLALSADGNPISGGDLPLTLPGSQVYFLPPSGRFLSTTFSYYAIDDGGTENGGGDTSEPQTVTLTLEVSDIFSLSTGGPIEGGVALIDANTLYTASSGDRVYRFDDSGTIEYTLNVAGNIKSSTTITPDHTVYIASTDNNLYSFNASGVSNPNWPLALGAEATASVAMDADKNIYIGTQNGIFQAVSPDGLVMWAYNVGGAVYASAAISSDNTLYIVNHNGRLYAFDLSTLNPANVQYKWRIETGGNVISSPALDDSSHVYLTTQDGRLLKVRDDNTTATVVWDFNAGSPIESSPIIDSEYSVYFGCDDGKVYAVDKAGSLKWEQTTGGPVKSTAALVEQGAETDRLYIGSNDGYLYALSLADGAIIWRYNTQSEIKAPTLYLDGRIYTGTIGGHIIALSDPDVGQSLSKATVVKRVWPTFQGDNARTGYQGSASFHIPDYDYLPSAYALHQNYPNPFNPGTTLRFDLPEASDITITVYDLLGREVVRLVGGRFEADYHQVIWDGKTTDGRDAPAGIYIALLSTPQYTRSIKLVLMK